MSSLRCDTCDQPFRNRRAIGVHLRNQQLAGQPHVACNDDNGAVQSSSRSSTKMTSVNQNSHTAHLVHHAGMICLPIGNGSVVGRAHQSPVGRAESPESFQGGGDSFESPVTELLSPGVSPQLRSDPTLCDKLVRHVQSGLGTVPVSAVHTREFKLLSICKPYSLKLYDEVIQWVYESKLAGVDFSKKLRTRSAILNHIETRYNMQGSQPQSQMVFLPGCGQTVELMVHDFKDQLYSLLSDPDVMRDENLLFHNNNPFQPPLDPRKRNGQYIYQDVNDGSVYYDAYQTQCKVEGRDILSAVIAFADKSHMDVTNSRLTMEPFIVTLSLFKKELRTKSMFWRPLGYLANQSQITYPSAHSVDKASDYHVMIQHILQSLVDVQNGPGIAWNLKYMGVTHKVVFKFPLMFVSGDTEGHDKLVGKYLSRGINVARLCRYCNTPTLQTCNPGFKFVLTKASDIEKLVLKEDKCGLQAISYHCLTNGFRHVQFCDPVYGINGATPAELLHTWQKGLFTRFLTAFFGQKRLKKEVSKRRKGQSSQKRKSFVSLPVAGTDTDQSEVEDDDGEEVIVDLKLDDSDSLAEWGEHTQLTGDSISYGRFQKTGKHDLSRVGVFTDSIKAEFDILAKLYGRCLQHQSDRSFNRSYFSQGVVSNCKKNGNEEHLVLLLCHIILVSAKGSYFDEALDGGSNQVSGQRTGQFIEQISQLLLIENFIQQSSFTLKEILDFKVFMIAFLKNYSIAVDRVDGAGMNFVKFHLPIHAAEDMLRFGPPKSFDSSTGESNHKEIKGPSRQTQRNTKTFEQQTANRVAENLLIDCAVRRSLSSPVTGPQKAPQNCGASYYVTEHGLFSNQKKKHPILECWPDAFLMGRIAKMLINQILPYIKGNKERRIQLYTEYNTSYPEKVIYRADPSYGSTGESWHDWATIDWDWDKPNPQASAKIPARLMIYFEISPSSILTQPIQIDQYCTIYEPGTFVILQSLVEQLDAPVPNRCLWSKNVQAKYGNVLNYFAYSGSSLIYWSCLEMDDSVALPLLRVSSVHSIYSPIAAVPYNIVQFQACLAQEEWLLVAPVDTWKAKCIDEMEEFREGNKK